MSFPDMPLHEKLRLILNFMPINPQLNAKFTRIREI